MSRERQLKLRSGQLLAELTIPDQAVIHHVPEDRAGAAEQTASALRLPIGLPALHECAVPGDRIVIVADPETPELARILEQIIDELQVLGDGGASITLLLPQDPTGQHWQMLASALAGHGGQAFSIQLHDPDDETQRGYLASSSGGERIYLNRTLLDADLIVSVGLIAFDGLLGYRGTSSVLFPNFSDAESIRETRGQGHPELTPDQRRPRRELVDEIGWLLGTQFTIQTVPGADGHAAVILAGAPEQVQQAGQAELDQLWRISADESMDLVVVTVPGGIFGWRQIGNALEMACRIVEPGGRVAVLADVPVPEGPGTSMLRRCQDPEDLLKPLRRDPPEDAVETAQLIQAQRRARLYLMSNLPTDIVEDLGMYNLADTAELQRLLDGSRRVAIIPGANFAWCDVLATRC